MDRTSKKVYYTIYRNKDDAIVASGTSDQVAKQLGIKVQSLYAMSCRSRHGELRKHTVYVEELEKDEQLD